MSIAFVRAISLTAPGVSTNEFLSFIIDEIIYETTKGVNVIDANGEDVIIFLKSLCFISDYPASSEVIGCMKHLARAPCTHCTFRHTYINKVPCYKARTKINSRHYSCTRSILRTDLIRSERITQNKQRFMGMKEGNMKNLHHSGHWPLLQLSQKLCEIQSQIPKTLSGKYVVRGSFELYQQNAVASDHLLTRISKGLIEFCFSIISNEEECKLNILLCLILPKMGINGDSSLYNENTNSLTSLSMYNIYSIIPVLPISIEIAEFNVP